MIYSCCDVKYRKSNVFGLVVRIMIFRFNLYFKGLYFHFILNIIIYCFIGCISASESLLCCWSTPTLSYPSCNISGSTSLRTSSISSPLPTAYSNSPLSYSISYSPARAPLSCQLVLNAHFDILIAHSDNLELLMLVFATPMMLYYFVSKFQEGTLLLTFYYFFTFVLL